MNIQSRHKLWLQYIIFLLFTFNYVQNVQTGVNNNDAQTVPLDKGKVQLSKCFFYYTFI